MARTAADTPKVKTVSMAGSITLAEREAIEQHIWSPDVRLKPGEFVTQALRTAIETLGLDVPAAQARLDAKAADKS